MRTRTIDGQDQREPRIGPGVPPREAWRIGLVSRSVVGVRLARKEPTRVPADQGGRREVARVVQPVEHLEQAPAGQGPSRGGGFAGGSGRPWGVIQRQGGGQDVKTATMCAISPMIPPIQSVWSQSPVGLRGTSSVCQMIVPNPNSRGVGEDPAETFPTRPGAASDDAPGRPGGARVSDEPGRRPRRRTPAGPCKAPRSRARGRGGPSSSKIGSPGPPSRPTARLT